MFLEEGKTYPDYPEGAPGEKPLGANGAGDLTTSQSTYDVGAQGRSQDFSKGGSQRLLTRSPSGDRGLYMVYTAAFPRASAGSVVLSRHEGPY